MRSFWRLKHAMGRRSLRPSDILVASFPKSGNTWVRFIFANLVSNRELPEQPVDFHIVNHKLLYAYDNGTFSDYTPKTFPRFVKTHSEYRKREFAHNRSVYVVRNPADVMVSYFLYRTAQVGKAAPGEFGTFLSSERYGVSAWISHYKSWIGQATSIVCYQQLRADALREMTRVFKELSVDVGNSELRKAVEESRLENVRKLEQETGHPQEMNKFKDGYSFVRSGKVGQYRDYFTEADYAFLIGLLEDNNLSELADQYRRA